MDLPLAPGESYADSTATFPQKLFAMMEIEDGEVVHWAPHGFAFVVTNQEKFLNEIVPMYFKHTKLTSFQRQLNLYGFRRLTKGEDQGAYFHPKFQRGRKDLMVEIRRLPPKGSLPTLEQVMNANRQLPSERFGGVKKRIRDNSSSNSSSNNKYFSGHNESSSSTSSSRTAPGTAGEGGMYSRPLPHMMAGQHQQYPPPRHQHYQQHPHQQYHPHPTQQQQQQQQQPPHNRYAPQQPQYASAMNMHRGDYHMGYFSTIRDIYSANPAAVSLNDSATSGSFNSNDGGVDNKHSNASGSSESNTASSSSSGSSSSSSNNNNNNNNNNINKSESDGDTKPHTKSRLTMNIGFGHKFPGEPVRAPPPYYGGYGHGYPQYGAPSLPPGVVYPPPPYAYYSAPPPPPPQQQQQQQQQPYTAAAVDPKLLLEDSRRYSSDDTSSDANRDKNRGNHPSDADSSSDDAQPAGRTAGTTGMSVDNSETSGETLSRLPSVTSFDALIDFFGQGASQPEGDASAPKDLQTVRQSTGDSTSATTASTAATVAEEVVNTGGGERCDSSSSSSISRSDGEDDGSKDNLETATGASHTAAASASIATGAGISSTSTGGSCAEPHPLSAMMVNALPSTRSVLDLLADDGPPAAVQDENVLI